MGFRSVTRPRVGRGLGCFGVYLLASLWLWRTTVPHLGTHALRGGLFDAGLFIWWLKWTPFAITHGLNPLHTTYLNAPGGVSAMWNTSVLGLGVVFAPVTLLFGAVVSFNLACILGPPLSAFTAWLWLRRHVHDVPAAIGGLVFGFSPFVIAESQEGHLQFTWLFLLPVILMLLEDVLWRAERPIWPQAPLLGFAVAAQLLIGSEALLIFALGCAGMAFLLLVTNVHAARQRLRVLAPAGAVALGVASVLCAWPLVEQFGGNRAIRQPVFPVGSQGGRLEMLVGAPRPLLFHTGLGPGGHLTYVENGLYVGWPLLVALAVAAAVLIRRRGVAISAAAIVVSIGFQMYGARWHLAGVSVPAPFRVLQDHVAVTRNILPGRFAIVMWLAIAWLLAVAIDAARARVPGQWPRKWAAAWFVVPPLVAAVLLVPLLPRAVPTRSLAEVPSLFTTSRRNIIPSGATVMLAPMPTAEFAAADLWQVEAEMRFRQIGGYMLHPVGPDDAPSFHSSAEMLTKLFQIKTSTHLPFEGEATPAMLRQARAELRAAHASFFLVGHGRTPQPRLLSRAEELLGRPPDQVIGGVALWRLRR